MFEEFWKIYSRKVAKKDCKRAWSKLTPIQQAAALEALPNHLAYWEASGRTPETIPHGATWLNGERWEDVLETPKAAAALDWWKSPASIEARARAVGLTPKPGETHDSLRARIMERLSGLKVLTP